MNSSFRNIILYGTEFFTGGSVLVLEILGTRVIGPFYGTTVFVWTSLILVTLGALAIGYFAGGWIADRYPKERILYSIVFVAGIFMFLPMKIDQWALTITNDLGFRFGPLGASLLLFFIPLLLLGMISPFVIRLLTNDIEQSGRIAGRVFAIGTVGSIVGGFLAGFYLLDKFTLTESLNATAIVLVIVSLIGLAVFVGKKKGTALMGWFAIIGIGTLMLPPYVYSDNYTLQIHHQEQSFYGDLKVMEIGVYSCLAVNGSFQSCYNNREERPTFTYVAEVARIIEEQNIESMLLLGLGSGNVLHGLPAELDVDVVEIDPKVFKLATEYFDTDTSHYDNIFFDDARHFFTKNEKQYDLILVDIALGSRLPAHIFSQNGMSLWGGSLSEGGLVLINGEGKLGDSDEQLLTIMKTAASAFSSVVLTVTEPDRYTSVLVHLSNDPEYTFAGGGKFSEVRPDYSQAEIMTDEFNSFDLISVEKLKIFRDEMVTAGGYRLLFSE